MEEHYKVTLPKLGESILSATVIQWFKKEGDRVKADEPLLEVSTDKVNSEIPSPVSGILKKILIQTDQEVEVGCNLAYIDTGHKTDYLAQVPERQEFSTSSICPIKSANNFYSPSIMSLASKEGLSVQDLDKIPRTGQEGRLTKKDVESYLLNCDPEQIPCRGETQKIKITGMRKAIADNMVKSFYQAPHASLITEVDVTDLLKVISAQKEVFHSQYGLKLTLTPFFMKALASALKQFPFLNSSIEGEEIVLKNAINIGIAVNLEQGLIVPVIKNCDQKSIAQISHEIQDLSRKAKEDRLSQEDIAQGTFTMSNFGMGGVEIGLPIIRFPEVGILAIGTILKKVSVMNDDQIAIRSKVHITLAFDHRIIDGMYGCAFLNHLKNALAENLVLS
ncbi:MAG: dihydrolipoamide acetyltransferase family protein [Rhabdochlamydiaceae bacterium]